MTIAKKHQDRLNDIKDKIKASHDYFEDNVNRYHEFMNFVFNTSLSSADVTALNVIQKPALEFNILEAMISRLRGEFAKQKPSINARAADGVPLDRLTPEFMDTIEVIEAHLREILSDGDNDSLQYRIYSDILAGGFSVMQVFTDYVNEFSFDQRIHVERVFDPTLCGFDPMAQEPHKGDGNYCFQLIPKTREEFEEEFGAEALKDAKFVSGSVGGSESDFNWTYKNQDQDIVLVADFYEKQRKHVKIVKISNGHVMQKRDYERFIELWEANDVLEQAPIIIEERWTDIEHIERYRLCGEKILEHTVTSFKQFPLVFVDGNSIVIRESESSAAQQMTRPYVYHAKGVQQMKNFCGQTICAEIENMVMSKFKIAAEAIHPEYKDAFINPQQASVLVYNAFFKDNPEQPLPPPMEVQRTEVPQIVQASFMGSDQVTQTILGSYDGVLGINSNQISGVAIQQGALQSNAAAIPYLMGYINGLNRVAQIIIDLIPKYYVTPRSIPIKGRDGKRSYKIINSTEVPADEDDNQDQRQERAEEGQMGQQGMQPKPKFKAPIMMGYDPNDLEIRIEAGPNAAIQKQVALDQITRMMASSQLFAEFINTKGLEIIIDNLDIRSADQMKVLAADFMKEQQAKQEQAMKMAQEQAGKPDPMVELANKDIQVRQQKGLIDAKIDYERAQTERMNDAAKVALQKQKQDLEYHKVMAQMRLEQSRHQRQIQMEEEDRAHAGFALALDALGHMNDAQAMQQEQPMQQMPQQQEEGM
jgi:hypothetical protein